MSVVPMLQLPFLTAKPKVSTPAKVAPTVQDLPKGIFGPIPQLGSFSGLALEEPGNGYLKPAEAKFTEGWNPYVQTSETETPVDALARYQAARNQINAFKAGNPYKDSQSVARPDWHEPDMELPTYQRENAKRVAGPSLDAALILGGLGSLFGSPQMGFQGGTAFANGAMKQAGQYDAEDYASQKAAYDNAVRQSMSRYQRDTDAYGMELKGIDSYNDNITKSVNDMEDTATAQYRIDQVAQTKAEETKAEALRKETSDVFRALQNPNLSPQATKALGIWLNKHADLQFDLSQALQQAPPSVQLRYQYLAASDEQKAQLRRELMRSREKIAQGNNEAMLLATRERIKAANERAVMNNNMRVVLSKQRQASVANNQRINPADRLRVQSLQTQVDRASSQENQAIKDLDRAQRSYAEAHQKLISQVYKNAENYDPSLAGPDNPDGLTDAGKLLKKNLEAPLGQYEDAIKAAEARVGAANKEHSGKIAELEWALNQLSAAGAGTGQAQVGQVPRFDIQPKAKGGVAPLRVSVPPDVPASRVNQGLVRKGNVFTGGDGKTFKIKN